MLTGSEGGVGGSSGGGTGEGVGGDTSGGINGSGAGGINTSTGGAGGPVIQPPVDLEKVGVEYEFERFMGMRPPQF